MRRVHRVLILVLVVSVVLASFGDAPAGIALAQGPLGPTNTTGATLQALTGSETTRRQVQPSRPSQPPQPPTDLGASTIRSASVDDRHPKLESRLAAIGRTSRVGSVQSALDQSRSVGISVVGSQVRVVVEAAGSSTAGAKAAVQANGGTVEAEYANLVQALLPPSSLDAVTNDPSVAYVRTPAFAAQEAVTGEGVAASGANTWQTAAITGSGVKVGVIDFGFTGYQQRQASGDLPAGLTVVDFCNGQITPTGGEHGTGVAEIVYETAPGLTLYLLCVGTDVQLGQAKDYAKTNGIKILSVSIGYRNTSRGDGNAPAGTPEAIAADARDNGILWVNSAGNYAQDHWSGVFTDVDGDDFHEFAVGDETQSVYLPTGQSACFLLKWDAWPTTAQDYDLLLFRSSDVSIVEQSINEQTGSQPPTEALCYTNPGSAEYFWVVIARYDATVAPRFDLFITRSNSSLEYVVAAGSLNDVASSPKSFSVGAECWQNNQLEPYSSQGPTIDGRIKPDITGFDSVSSATYGNFSVCAGASGFAGTSAAQPYVAGAAALVKQANSSFTAAQLQAFLEGRAVDQGAGGKDNLYGAGRLALGTPPSAPANADLSVTLTDSPDPVYNGETVTYTVSIINNGPQTATGAAVSLSVSPVGSEVFVSSTCPATASGATCSGLTLTSGQTVQYQVVMRGNAVGTTTATVTATSGVSDPNSGNNTANQQTTILTPVACSPRPPVTVATSIVGGRLQVTLVANDSNNVLKSVRFGTDTRPPSNSLLDLPDGRTSLAGGLTVAFSQPPTSYTFWVRRGIAGEPTTVPLLVTDGCGAWETFVGGGSAAGF